MSQSILSLADDDNNINDQNSDDTFSNQGFTGDITESTSKQKKIKTDTYKIRNSINFLMENSAVEQEDREPTPPAPVIPESPKKVSDSTDFSHTLRFSTSTITGLPVLIKKEILNFNLKGFAKSYFTEQKKGLVFKKVIPINELLSFSKDKLKKPLTKKLPLKCY
jgi:hypothetical protein